VKSFALVAALLLLPLLGKPQDLRACTVTGATITYSDDDEGFFYLNGSLLSDCNYYGCWNTVTTYTLTPAQLALLNAAPGDNVLAAYGTDTNGSLSGMTWDLAITYSDNATQDIQSDGSCTVVDYAGDTTAGVGVGTPPVVFPANWNQVVFSETGWNGAYVGPPAAGWMTVTNTAGVAVPWIWGVNSFNAGTPGEGYLFRQHFQLCSSSCNVTPQPTPTACIAGCTFGPTPVPLTCSNPPLLDLGVSASGCSSSMVNYNFTITNNSASPAPINSIGILMWLYDTNASGICMDNYGATLYPGGTYIGSPVNLAAGAMGPVTMPANRMANTQLSVTGNSAYNIAPGGYLQFSVVVHPCSYGAFTDFANSYTNIPTFQGGTCYASLTSPAQDDSHFVLTYNGIRFPEYSSGTTLDPIQGVAPAGVTFLSCSTTVTVSATPSPSPTPSASPTRTPSRTTTATPSQTPSRTATATWTPTSSPSPVDTATDTPSASPTATWTPTASPTPTATLTSTPTRTPTASPSITPTSTDTPIASPTATPTWTPSYTASPTPSATPTWTPTLTLTATPSTSPTASPSLSPSDTPTQSATATDTPTASDTPTATPTSTQSETPSASPSATPTATITATPSATLTASPTLTATPTPSATSTATPTATRTASATVSPTRSPSPTASPSPTPAPPYSASLAVYNSAGELVGMAANSVALWTAATGLAALSPVFLPDQGQQALVAVQGTNVSLGWSGRNAGGQLVASGAYTLKLELRDPFGNVTSYSVTVNVLRDPQTVSVNVYNSAGELVRQFPTQALDPTSAADLTLKAAAFAPSISGGGSLSIGYGSAGEAVAWDGRNAAGNLVAPGSYLIAVTSTKGGVSQRWEKPVTVLGHGGGDPLDSAVAGPNPTSPTDLELRINLPAAPAGVAVGADIYDLYGERVIHLDRAADGYLHWPLNKRLPASGLYLTVLRAQDGQGRWVMRTIKLAVIR